jgi:uncharacterized membrane protein
MRGAWSDQRVERAIGRLLRVGVVAAALVAAGGVLYLARHGGPTGGGNPALGLLSDG